MLWQFLKRHRRKIFLLSLLGGSGYAAFRYLNGKLQSMMKEQDAMLVEWKKQLYYEHNRDTSLKTSKSKTLTSEDFEYILRYGYICTSRFEYQSSIPL